MLRAAHALVLLAACAAAQTPEIERIAGVIESQGESAPLLVRLGEAHFRAARIAESVEAFDRAIALDPRIEPYLWQRGIALYYAGRFEDAYRQFESHQRVNPADVENGAWHFLCLARARGLDEARARLLPIGADPRVPMAEIWRLFRGEADAASVFAAARRGEPGAVRGQLFYGHLYVALYREALGDAAGAREHIAKAAGEFAQPHYMGDVARVHAKLAARRPLH